MPLKANCSVAVIGCGAMGSIYAGLFAASGHDVLAVDRDRGHVDAINDRGLRVEGASGDRVVRIRAATEAPENPADLVIVAVKAMHVVSAVSDIRKLLGRDTIVLTIQNGLGSADILAAEIGGDQLAVGVASAFGASLRAPGHAHHEGMEAVRMGPYGGLSPARVEGVAALWRAAGFTAEAVPNIAVSQWEKLICNVASSALCAITGFTTGQVMNDPDLGPVSRAAATEAWEVARARGVPIRVTDPAAHVRAHASRIPNAKPSVLQDIERGRPTEIDVINGAIPREAAKAGRSAPVNATLTALVKLKERSFAR